MFVQQGARQFEIFTGKPAPEEEMFRVVLHALRQQVEAAATAEPAESKAKAKPAGLRGAGAAGVDKFEVMRIRVLGGVTVEVGDCYRKNPLGTDAGTAGSVVTEK